LLNFGFFDYLFLYFNSCNCYKLLIISLMKAASIDGPFDFLTACPILISKCIVMLITGQKACLLTDVTFPLLFNLAARCCSALDMRLRNVCIIQL